MRIGILILVAVGLMGGCSRYDHPVPPPVAGVEWERYLGTWYEIARYDHRFERNMVAVTANYDRREDGNIAVVNRGYHVTKEKWRQSTAKAYGFDEVGTGSIQVQFFWPFSGEYRIIALDKDYQWALVGSSSPSYLWILARTPSISDSLKESLLATIIDFNYTPDDLIWVDQSLNTAEP